MPQPLPTTLTILRRKQVEAECGYSRSTIYLRITQGLWTRPISLGPRAVGWPASVVERNYKSLSSCVEGSQLFEDRFGGFRPDERLGRLVASCQVPLDGVDESPLPTGTHLGGCVCL